MTTVTSLEQVLVYFEAVVAGVCHNDVAVISNSEALRAIERVSRRVDK